jgi:prepilin signal peptidase PulO-like enzyme (type II secretory pathway)
MLMNMTITFPAFFIFGLIIGSFLNVLVYRLRDAETLLGRSFCRHCEHQIRWYDNIPLVSFILLRGACRDCGTKISWQYPTLEFLTGILFALVGYFFFSPTVFYSWLETAWLLSIVSILLVIGVYDLRHMEISLSMLIAGVLITYVFLICSFVIMSEPLFVSRLWQGLFGGLVVCGFFFLLVWFSKETWMGWGDVWFGFVAGSIVGLPLVLPMLTLSFGCGAFVGIIAIVFQKKGLKSQIPFAPFLAFGVILTLFLPKVFPIFTQYLMW